MRACRLPRQIGCVVAFSGFNAPVPPNSLFGRTTDANLEVLCTNPPRLRGGSGAVTSIYPTERFADSVIGGAANAAVSGLPRPKTPWAEFPNPYSARCSNADGASVLQLTPRGNVFDLVAVPDATWGLHLADANIALGNLVGVVRRQIAAYSSR